MSDTQVQRKHSRRRRPGRKTAPDLKGKAENSSEGGNRRGRRNKAPAKVERSSSGSRNRRNRSKGNKRATNDSSIYDIFGAKRSRFSPKDKAYKAEFNQIDLPKLPVSLVCAICKQETSSLSDVLEALEVRRGEFDGEGTGALDDVLPAHFECVMQALTKTCNLQEGESVAYLGSGKFAVIEGPQRKVKRMIERSAWAQNSSLSPTNWSKWRQDLNSHTLLAALSIETDV